MSPSSPEFGLRARKRRATENAIELSAVDLALTLGVENVTVEAICDRANVSRSTFFNYFAGRDYAIVGRAISVLPQDEAFGVLDTAPGDLPRGVFRLVFASIGHSNVNTEVARKRFQLTTEQPEARRMKSVSMLESHEPLVEVATLWLEAHPEHVRLDSPVLEATISVSLAYASINVLMLDWRENEGDILTNDSALDGVFDDIRTTLAGSANAA